MKQFKFVGLCLLIATFSFSCSKYEEGPWLSLKSKKARITNNWVIEDAQTENGTNLVGFIEDYELIIEKDGTWNVPENGIVAKATGTWQFTNEDKNFKSTDSDGIINEATIIKLKENEFWIKSNDPNDEFTIHYKSK